MINKIRHYILLRLGIIEIKNAYRKLEQELTTKIDFLTTYISLTQNEILHIDKGVLDSVTEELKSQYHLKEINTTVHKNDLMFLFQVHRFRHDPRQAVFLYFNIGVNISTNLKSITKDYHPSPKRILDFGSGYGRVSRFFPSIFPESEIVVSDVKELALEFQKNYFNFQEIYHNEDPESFGQHRFDLILALSVFTHLPRAAFRGWMEKLLQTLNTGGVLVFTFNNLEDLKEGSTEEFVYQQHSEDSMLSFVPDSIKDTDKYGVTSVSYGFLESLFSDRDVSIRFLKRELVHSQEALLVIKN